MLLFQKRFHAGLTSGDVTLTFRRWDKPHVKIGGRYRCHPIGVLEVDRIDRVRVADITDDDARRSGFDTRGELIEYMRTAKDSPLRKSTAVFRVELHHAGDGDRVSIAMDDTLSAETIAAIETALERMDREEPWTTKTLALIAKHPHTAASQLAKKLGRDTLPFKADVRRLKRLGLTQSFEVGYEISPRGRAFLAARPRKRTAKKAKARPSSR